MIKFVYHNYCKYLNFYFILSLLLKVISSSTTFIRILIASKYHSQYKKHIILYILMSIFYSLEVKSDDSGCFSYECLDDRIVNVIVIVDSKYYLNNFINNLLEKSFKDINDFYYKYFKIKWNIINIVNFTQNKDISSISELYTFHKEEIRKIVIDSEAEVGLVVAGNEIKGLGIAGTFSNIAMVSNLDKIDINTTSVIIAHEFAHLFGAWHTQKEFDFMLFRGASTLNVSKESKSILKLMRNYNFNANSILKKDNLLKRISRLYLRHHARNEIDPVARLLTDQGLEYYKNNKYSEAAKILEKSLTFYGRWGKTRMVLSKVYFELEQYNLSFTELTRAVFFGEKPDLVFEKKLHSKFIDLKKADPNVINPFESR